MKKKSCRSIHHALQQGVTLIEMLVVVAIIAMVSSVLIFNYSDFSTNVSVRNLSQEIALSVRKAQTYATSVRPIEGLSGVDSATFPGYGISFATNTTTTPPDVMTPGPRQFILYADAAELTTNTYDQGNQCGHPAGDASVGECLESFGITTADKIVSICGTPDGGRLNPNGSDCYTDAKVDITYRRPSPDAIICMTSMGIDGNCGMSYVVLNLQSAKGLKRSVVIWNTGQISVQ